MEFGIKCVTVCTCDWLLFVFYYMYIVHDIAYDMIFVLFIWIYGDIYSSGIL